MRLNLIYAAALSIALVVLIVVGFLDNNVLGYVVWMITAIVGGLLVLWQKNRLNTSWVWILLFFTAGFGFPIGVLCLKPKEKDSLIDNKNAAQDAHGRTMADYDKAVKLKPDNADAYYERGDFHYEIGQHSKAIADYSRAIELEPHHALAYFNRAYAYGETGAYDKAIADYGKAIELDPSDAQAYYNRGLDYQNRGETSKAVSDLEKCIELSTDPDVAKEARRALNEVKSSDKRAK